MKFRKKALSLLLAALMMLSCISVSFCALAAESSTEKPAKTAALEEKFTELFALNVSLGTAKPQITVDESDSKYASQKERVEKWEQAQALYKEILPMYKAMNDSEKDAVDITLALKFLQNAVNQESYDLAVAANPDKPLTTEFKIAGQEKLFEKIGPHTARDEALKAAEKLWEPVGTKMSGKNEVPVLITTYLDFSAYEPAAQVLTDYIAAYKAASPMVRRYMDGVNPSTKTYGVILVGGKLTDIVKMIAQKQMTLDGQKYAEPKPPATDKEATQKWNAANYNHEADLDYAAFLSVTDGLEDLKNVREAVTLLRTGYQDFLAISEVTKAEEGIKAYEALDTYEQLFYSKLSFKSVAFASVSNKGVWSNTQVNTNKLYDKCVDARNIVYVQEFEKWLQSVDLSKVDNDLVAEALAKFDEIPASVRSMLTEEAKKIYDDILAKYDPVKPITPGAYDYALEIAAHNADLTRVTLPDSKYANEAGVNKAMAELDKLLNAVLQSQIEGFDANAGLSASVFTNATVGKLLCLYDTLYNTELNVDAMGMSLNIGPILGGEGTPDKIAKLITDGEPEFAAAKAKLASAPTKTTADYQTMVWGNGDWGFQDGDKEGFKNAVACVLRPIAKVLDKGVLIIGQIIKLPNYNAENGDYCYGAYESLIPALESIGLSVPSSAQYTDDYNAALAKSKEQSYSALLFPVISAVVDLLDEFSDAPVETLVKYLPQIGYTVDSGILDASVKETLGKSSLLSGLASSLDLSGDGLNNMLTANPISFDLSEGNTVSIQLRDVNWYALSHCGKAYLASSVRASEKYRVGIEADKVKTFSVLYYYLYDILFTEPNFSSVKTGVKNMSSLVGLIASPLLNKIADMGKVDSYGLVLNTLNGDPAADLKDDAKDTIQNIINKLPNIGGDDDKNSDNKDDNSNTPAEKPVTDTPSVPKTAGVVSGAGAAFSLAVSAAVVIVAIRRRRDTAE